MTHPSAPAPSKAHQEFWDICGWSLVVILLVFAFKMYAHGFSSEHPRTFDEGLHLWLAHHLIEKPDDYSAKELHDAEVRAGADFSDFAKGYLTQPLYKHPPLFINLVKFALRWSYSLIPPLMGCLVILLAYLFCRTAYGVPVGLTAALFLAFDPNLWIASQKLWMETTLAAFFLTALTCFLKCTASARGRYFLLGTGIALGLAVNVRYTAFLFLLGFFLYALFFERRLIRNILFWSIPLVMLVILGPWILKNIEVYGWGPNAGIFDAFTASKGRRAALITTAIAVLIPVGIVAIALAWRRRDEAPAPAGAGAAPSRALSLLWASAGAVFFLWLFLDPGFRSRLGAMLSPAIPVGSFEIEFFRNETWPFYFGRFLELSPVYLFSYLVFFLPLVAKIRFQRADLILITHAALFTGFIVLWRSYQCRYALPSTLLLLMLAARVIQVLWRRITELKSQRISVGLRGILILGILGAIAKTVWVDLKFVLPNDMAYY